MKTTAGHETDRLEEREAPALYTRQHDCVGNPRDEDVVSLLCVVLNYVLFCSALLSVIYLLIFSFVSLYALIQL